jgi:hypothetical protein
MRIGFAYLSVVLLWATTPLAIKWSIADIGFLFGVTSRMVIGMLCVLLVLWCFSFPSSGLGMPTLKLCLAFGAYKRKNKLALLAVTPSGAWQ